MLITMNSDGAELAQAYVCKEKAFSFFCADIFSQRYQNPHQAFKTCLLHHKNCEMFEQSRFLNEGLMYFKYEDVDLLHNQHVHTHKSCDAKLAEDISQM